MFEEFIFSRKGGCKRWLYVFAGLLPQRAARGLPEPRAVRMGGDGSVGPAVKGRCLRRDRVVEWRQGEELEQVDEVFSSGIISR